MRRFKSLEACANIGADADFYGLTLFYVLGASGKRKKEDVFGNKVGMRGGRGGAGLEARLEEALQGVGVKRLEHGRVGLFPNGLGGAGVLPGAGVAGVLA